MPDTPRSPGAASSPAWPADFGGLDRSPEFFFPRRRGGPSPARSGDTGASWSSAAPFASTSETARSGREPAGSPDPADPEACCGGASPPWLPGLGCLRAAEPAALATAVTPSFAGRRPAEPRM